MHFNQDYLSSFLQTCVEIKFYFSDDDVLCSANILLLILCQRYVNACYVFQGFFKGTKVVGTCCMQAGSSGFDRFLLPFCYV